MKSRFSSSFHCRIVFLFTILLSFLFIPTAGCDRFGCGEPSEEQPEEILIGAIFTLSGTTSETGGTYAAGVRDSLKEVNDQGGIGGLPVRLIEKDSSYYLSKAISSYKDLKKKHPIVAIMSWGTGETEALSPLLQRDQIPCISGSFSGSLSDPEKTPYNFIGGATYQDQFLAACRYILETTKEKKRKPRVALIYSDTAFGRSPFFPEGVVRAAEIGVEIVDHVIVGLDETDATLQLSDLRELNLDYAIVQQTGAATAVLLKDAAKIGWDVPMIGLGWTMDESLLEAAEKATEGFLAISTHPFWLSENREGSDRIVKLGQKYGHPKGKLGKNYFIGYCNGRILIRALENCLQNLSGECIRREIENINQFTVPSSGVILSYRDGRHYPDMPVWMFQIKNGAFEPAGGPYLPDLEKHGQDR